MSQAGASPSSAGRTAMVIGCGIAGPVAAMFLRRAGLDATIYEAQEAPSDFVGSFLMVTPNGLDVLRTLGVLDDLVPHGLPCGGMVMRNSRGRRLGEVRHDGGHGSSGSLIIKRGLLHRVLREEAVRRGVPIEFGRKLADIESAVGRPVVARFEDGSSASADCLIGCDGVYSRTRQVIDPAAPRASYVGRISAGGFLRLDDPPPKQSLLTLTLGHRAFFGHVVSSTGEVYWFSDMAYPGQPTRRDLEAIDREVWKRTLTELHHDDPAPIPAIVGGLHREFGVYPLYDVPPLPTWHRGPVTLIGDAAHATSPYGGQGASMAMESAIVVAKCLRDVPDPAEAFATYQRLRKERAEKLVRLARRNGKHNEVTNPLGVKVRDLAMPLVLKAVANARSRSWVYSYSVDWDSRVA